MGFSPKQIRQLGKQPHPKHLRTREAGGRELVYIEGWHAIDEANRIFGFDGWDRETVETRCVAAREVKGVFRALYLARVRVSVRADGVQVVREGCGTGEARGVSYAEAHDMALKTAETDATKRALATFGRPFGLALHLGARLSPDGPSARSRSNGTRNQPKPDPANGGTPSSVARLPPKAVIKTGRDRTPRRYVSSLAPRSFTAAEGALTTPHSPAASATLSGSESPDSDIEPSVQSPLESPSRPASDHAPINSLEGTERGQPDRSATSANSNPEANNSPSGENVSASPSVHPDPSNDDAGSAIDKSLLTHGAPRRYRDKNHLRFVAAQPCLICSRQPCDAHHLRFAQARALGRKVSDQFTVPLCRLHHRQLHQSGKEEGWWAAQGIDPLPIAEELWSESRLRRLGKPGSSILSRSEP